MRKTDRTMSMTKTLRGFESIPGTETVFVATEDEIICDRQKKDKNKTKWPHNSVNFSIQKKFRLKIEINPSAAASLTAFSFSSRFLFFLTLFPSSPFICLSSRGGHDPSIGCLIASVSIICWIYVRVDRFADPIRPPPRQPENRLCCSAPSVNHDSSA